MSRYLDLINERVVVFDGAAGTYLQEQNLTADDFGGADLEGCNELLVDTRPDVVRGMHRAYFEAGAHVVETNTFGAFGVPLAEYDLAERTRELNQKAAGLASEVAEEMSSPGDPRLVAGSIGPGTKFASLGNIRYAELRDLYHEQALGLLEGGIDLFIIETQFDLLGAKAAMNGCRAAMRELDQAVPLQVQVTMELTGRMLPGTEIGAALVGPRRDATRRDRTQLRDRSRRDARAPPLPVPALPDPHLVPAQRRAAVGGRRPDALRPDRRAVRRVPDPVRQRAGHRRGRRLLRHHTRLHRPAGHGRGRPGAGARASRPTRTAPPRSTASSRSSRTPRS